MGRAVMDGGLWTLEATSGRARAGRLRTPHGEVATPCFMTVGTAASVKGMTPAQLRAAGAEILLANTYHLALRPGADRVRAFGGLAEFMGWHGPTLTDSGGYQVFSLAKRRRLEAGGVRFQSHIDGKELFLSPESATDIQQRLGADLFMCLDVCPPGGAGYDDVAQTLGLTHAWAARCQDAWTNRDRQALFGIVQGGVHEQLRRESAEALAALDLPGYAVGGVAVGEAPEEIRRVVAFSAPLLPAHKPRYLMGVGRPGDIVHAVAHGIDMFDCVMPTRHARHAQAFTRAGAINLKNARFADDHGPLEDGCLCEACRTVSRGYIRHLNMLGELMGLVYLTIHNVTFYLRLMADLRAAIHADRLDAFVHAFDAAQGTSP